MVTHCGDHDSFVQVTEAEAFLPKNDMIRLKYSGKQTPDKKDEGSKQREISCVVLQLGKPSLLEFDCNFVCLQCVPHNNQLYICCLNLKKKKRMRSCFENKKAFFTQDYKVFY